MLPTGRGLSATIRCQVGLKHDFQVPVGISGERNNEQRGKYHLDIDNCSCDSAHFSIST
jgi:hypothetical protein